MRTKHKISIALLPFALIGSEIFAQSTAPALPDSPTAQSLLIASAQSSSIGISPPPGATEGTPTLLTRQEAEQIALANNPRILISQLIAKVQREAVRERRAD